MINIIEWIGTEKREKHVWDKFYLQMCSLSYLDVQNDNLRIGQKKKHVCLCVSVFLYHYLDQMITNGPDRNGTEWIGQKEKWRNYVIRNVDNNLQINKVAKIHNLALCH
jgi:hypothetical protein